MNMTDLIWNDPFSDSIYWKISNNKFEFSHVLSSEVNQAALRKAARPRSWNMNNLI